MTDTVDLVLLGTPHDVGPGAGAPPSASAGPTIDWDLYLTEPRPHQCESWVVEDPAGGYSAFAAYLPGVVSEGESIDDALMGLREALEGALATYRDAGDPIPWTAEPVTVESSPVAKRWLVVNA